MNQLEGTLMIKKNGETIYFDPEAIINILNSENEQNKIDESMQKDE